MIYLWFFLILLEEYIEFLKKKLTFPVFLTSRFTVSVTPSVNTLEFSNDFIILISLFKINSVNHFPALIAPFPLIFLWNLFITLEVMLPTNAGILSLAKAIAMLVSDFFLNYLTKNQKIHLIKLF